MALYLILFLDRSEYVYAVDEVRCLTDEKAIVVACLRPAPSFGAGFEIWQSERLVHREFCLVPFEHALMAA